MAVLALALMLGTIPVFFGILDLIDEAYQALKKRRSA